MKLVLHLIRSTKNKCVYGEKVDDPAIEAVYISKSKLPMVPKQKITVTIEADES